MKNYHSYTIYLILTLFFLCTVPAGACDLLELEVAQDAAEEQGCVLKNPNAMFEAGNENDSHEASFPPYALGDDVDLATNQELFKGEPNGNIFSESFAQEEEAESKEDAENKETQHSVNGNKGRSYACDRCEKVYKYKAHLITHERIHTGEQPFMCTFCGDSFSSKSLLTRHMNNICTQVKTYQCPFNDFLTDCPHKFKMHAQKHLDQPFVSANKKAEILKLCNNSAARDDDRKELASRAKEGNHDFKCEQCGKTCKSHVRLIKHQQTHSKDRPFACPKCPSRFTFKCNLTTHIRIHTGEKPHGCEFCQKRFRTSSHLKVHRVIHTKEMNYTCEWCGKKFIHRNSRNCHRKRHEQIAYKHEL